MIIKGKTELEKLQSMYLSLSNRENFKCVFKDIIQNIFSILHINIIENIVNRYLMYNWGYKTGIYHSTAERILNI